uniref:Uncharacterized protein LOC111127111 isoform X1 n=2 Tax=Crassostrea virginica TaxID=6565 RepID=A0A8B8DLI2_CRAVI|nr:uncharacterized protein LOC111127111 isoform X1 [Crassostrea virginica]
MKKFAPSSSYTFVFFCVMPRLFVAEYLETTFFKISSLNDKKTTTNMLWQITGSKVTCLVACATDPRCISCFLDGQSYCSGHSLIYRPSSTLQDSQGLWYYELNDAASKLGCVAVPGETGYCVKLNVTKLAWSDQETACESDNMRLASLTTDNRVTFVQNYLIGIGHTSATTLGAQLISGTWIWKSGDTLSVTSPHWGPGEPTTGPDENCLMMAYATGYRLNDGMCWVQLSFLCDLTFLAN